MTVTLLDCAIIVNKFQPKQSLIFEDYAKKVIMPLLRKYIRTILGLDIVWNFTIVAAGRKYQGEERFRHIEFSFTSEEKKVKLNL